MPRRTSVCRKSDLCYLHWLYLLTGLAEYRQFHKFIILTMMLPFSHDSSIGWEEVSGVTLGGSRARTSASCGPAVCLQRLPCADRKAIQSFSRRVTANLPQRVIDLHVD